MLLISSFLKSDNINHFGWLELLVLQMSKKDFVVKGHFHTTIIQLTSCNVE